jgi:hypothetical protein
LGPTIQCCGHNVVVLDEEHGVVFSEVPLRNEAQQEVHQGGGVDSHKEIAHVLADYRQVDVSPKDVWPVSVNDPEGEGNGEANEVCEGDPLISLADRNQIFGHPENDGKTVELLNVLSTPDVGAENSSQDLALIGDDSVLSVLDILSFYFLVGYNYVIIMA